MNKNIKLYSIYKIFAYDIFFFYAISFFFFITVKHFSVSQILILDALYPIYGIILQIPSGIIVQKFGIKNSMVFGNMLWVVGFIRIHVSTFYVFHNNCRFVFCIRKCSKTNNGIIFSF